MTKDRKAEADRWLKQARSDPEFLPAAVAAGKHDVCCFLAQQAAEKALKAFLFSQGEELIPTHSIFRLCTMAAGYDAVFTELRDQVKQLDFYYVEARHPNALEDVIPAEFFTESDAREAMEMAGLVLSTVEGRLGATRL